MLVFADNWVEFAFTLTIATYRLNPSVTSLIRM